MIVPSMTVQEIHKELFKDFENLSNKLDFYRKDFKKEVLRTNQYPLSISFDYKTPEKKNLFVVTFTALKRSSWKKPILSFYAIYSRPEGNYGAALTVDLKITSIYPPHFFKRYRERFLDDESISNEDVIRYYFDNEWGFVGALVNKDYEAVFHCFEKEEKDEKLSFVAATSQGYCFGEKQGNINIIKTIISESMLYDNQKSVFMELRNIFNRENKERYGENVSDWI